jgi:hypothetical protein
MDTEQDSLLQQEEPATPKGCRGSSRGVASLSLAATASPAPGAKKSGELPRQERQRIEQETNKPRFKPGGESLWITRSTE